jgi:hypothetical protein
MSVHPPLLSGLAASALLLACLAPAAAAIDVTASIVNVAPVIVSISLAGLDGGALQPTAGTTTSLTATVVASDTNGATDVTGITVGIVKPDGSTVHVAQSAASLSGNDGLLATYTKTLTMAYHDAAAEGASTYKVRATATDAGGLVHVGSLTMAVFNYGGLVALNAPSVFGLAAVPGGASPATLLTVNNYGNVRIDAQVSGTDLAGESASLDVGDVDYSLGADMAGAVPLSESPATLAAYDLAPASGAAKGLYFRLTPTTPADGLPAGDYVGSLTVTAVAG